MTKSTTEESSTLPLPFVEHGQKVIETSFSLGGTIQHPEAQPPYAYCVAGEPRIFVVVAFTDGYGVKPADGEKTLSWANKLKLSEAFELSQDEDLYDVKDAEGLVAMLRERVREAMAQLATGDKPDHAPPAVKKARKDETSVTITGPGGEAVETTVGDIKAAAARTRAAAKVKAKAS